MALILDVARFKYPPHWVPLPLLWEAMNTTDEASGLHRGFMLISRLHRAPALLYTLSCKHESWVSIAKYLVDDVPVLLSSDNVKDMKNVLSIVFTSLPSKFAEFIMWVAEVRRLEDDGQNLSEEEKGRVAVKEDILKQVQEIGLYKHVTDYFLSSGKSCNQTQQSMGSEDSLPDIAASICCQGAGLLAGNRGSSDGFCCTCVKCIKTKGDHDDKPVTVVSGMVVNGNGEQRVDVLVPSSQTNPNCCGSGPTCCIGLHPASSDVMTALLLALPPQTWSGIKEEKLLQEIRSLVSTEKLPTLLQEEVLHLRSQLLILKRCKDNKVKLRESRGDTQLLKCHGDQEKLVFQRCNFCSQRNTVNFRDGNAITYSGNLPFLGRNSALSYSGGYVHPARVWGGIRPMTACLKAMLYTSYTF